MFFEDWRLAPFSRLPARNTCVLQYNNFYRVTSQVSRQNYLNSILELAGETRELGEKRREENNSSTYTWTILSQF
jgi:ABC-type multidrug transport system permease subunit